jgi:hypothetical protein
MHWKLLGRFDLARGSGTDVSRSAAGRGGAEAIWVPTALLPRFGVTWTVDDDHHITARHQLGTTPITTPAPRVIVRPRRARSHRAITIAA